MLVALVVLGVGMYRRKSRHAMARRR
jgi:hypothetical protein